MKKILVLVCLVLFLGTLVSVEYAAADRFVNNNDGTVTDTQTGLMWANSDNGSNIDWYNAKSYCEGYSGGGKSGWRMPTTDELGQLRNSGAYGSVIKKTAGYVWATRGSEAAIFPSYSGFRKWTPQSVGNIRALPVRSGK
ncbi:MAG TPA: hypothetical protein DCG53_03480 [Syntrophus sp. (in: bacteria)]|jgi:hypothetical protein|nr:hypothetical protein [Syntrophus sp. (in: bacteria)]